MAAHLGEAFVHALATKDADRLRALLRSDVEFRAVTPGRFWEANDAATVIDDVLFGEWFEESDDITDVVEVETSEVGTRQRVGYRLAVTTPDGDHLVEEQAYFDIDGDRISWMRVLCAGFQPVGP